MRLFVVEPNGRGGMIHYAYQLCTALAEAGAQVTLVTSRDYELTGLAHHFQVQPIMRLWPQFDPESQNPPRTALGQAWRRCKWNVRRAARAVQLILTWNRLCRFLIAQRPDVVQFGKIHFPFEARFLARLRRKGLTLTQICHEFELRERGGCLARCVDRLYASVYPQFAAVFLHGQANRQRFLALFNYPADRAHVIAHGNESLFLTAAPRGVRAADLRRRYNFDDDQPVVLFFGILAPSKGIDDLLRAFVAVRRRHPRARLLIAGFPSKHVDMRVLEQLAAEPTIADAVSFDRRYIPMEQVPALMELATVVVYPYRNATQSGALQIAYAFGKPVVATTVGGLPEAIDDGRNGLLVPPRSPDALAEALARILDDPALARRMGEHSRHLGETRYAWRPIADEILNVYRTLPR